jgi:hypothetical protein
MKPVSGRSWPVQRAGDWHGDITAAGHRDARLVVARGSGLSQRIEVLPHLSAKSPCR